MPFWNERDLAADETRAARPHVLLAKVGRDEVECAYVFQPHAHVLVTTRPIVDTSLAGVGDTATSRPPTGRYQFGEKDRSWGKKVKLHGWRRTWQDAYNGLLRDHVAPGQLPPLVDCRAGWRRCAEAAASPPSAKVPSRCAMGARLRPVLLDRAVNERRDP